VSDVLTEIAGRICGDDPKYAPTLSTHLAKMDDEFRTRAQEFFDRYKAFLESDGKTLDFGLECFKRLRANVQEERFKFLRTGKYANESFADVNRAVYGNPEIMQSYMHGLAFAQFLWPEQYRRFSFFCEHLDDYRDSVRAYLEVGGGHGLYVMEAVRRFREGTRFDVVDISTSSLELAGGIAKDPRIHYHLTDILEFPETDRYDFITMGEVLEHVERPRELLAKVRGLLAPDGHAYITTPANAPMVDHIHLFRSADEIRAMLRECGFDIEREVTQFAADLPVERCIALKTPLMFGAFVRKA
jgi:2-polyprenyl-3-methyl-5-hydroxy-6-metoxy-1,4-benzoquinol methylase